MRLLKRGGIQKPSDLSNDDDIAMANVLGGRVLQIVVAHRDVAPVGGYGGTTATCPAPQPPPWGGKCHRHHCTLPPPRRLTTPQAPPHDVANTTELGVAVVPHHELTGAQHAVQFTIAAPGYPLPPVGGLRAVRKYDNIMHRLQRGEPKYDRVGRGQALDHIHVYPRESERSRPR